MAEETLIQKIRSLPPERVAEVEDFVDFLTARDQDRHFTQAATRLSEEAVRAVWRSRTTTFRRFGWRCDNGRLSSSAPTRINSKLFSVERHALGSCCMA